MNIEKGQRYKTINEGDFHGKTALIIIKVTGQKADDYVFWRAETPIKYKRRYNKGSARVWWFREFCKRIEGVEE